MLSSGHLNKKHPLGKIKTKNKRKRENPVRRKGQKEKFQLGVDMKNSNVFSFPKLLYG